MSHADLFDDVVATLRDAAGAKLVGPNMLDLMASTLRSVQRSDWAVRVLDACGVAWKNSVPAPIPVYNEPSWVVVLPMHIGAKYGPTPDAARLAAAQAVFPELPDAVRAELGACP